MQNMKGYRAEIGKLKKIGKRVQNNSIGKDDPSCSAKS